MTTVLLWLTCAFSGPLADSQTITVDAGVRVTPGDKRLVSASVSGMLTMMDAKEGQLVKAGEVIGHVDDRATKLAVETAALEHKIAEEKATNDVNFRYSQKAYEVAAADVGRAEFAQKKYDRTFSETEMAHRRLTAERSLLEIE